MANTTIYPYGTDGSLPSSIGLINDLYTGGVDKALTAEQGKVLNQQLLENKISVDGNTLIVGELITGYVQDGLVFHLDAIDKGETVGKWTDIVGGIQYTNQGCTFNESSIEFPSDSTAWLETSTSLQFHADTNTIEIVYEGDLSGQNRFLFYPNLNNGIMIAYASSLNVFILSSTTGRTTYTPKSLSGKSRLSMNKQVAIQNTEQLSSQSANYFSDLTSTGYIGTRSTATSAQRFSGKIYSIRIYNRLLSADEMLRNQAYDITRFNLY